MDGKRTLRLKRGCGETLSYWKIKYKTCPSWDYPKMLSGDDGGNRPLTLSGASIRFPLVTTQHDLDPRFHDFFKKKKSILLIL